MRKKANNIEINYTKNGEGRPVILLHGNGEDYHIFDKLIPLLSNSYTVYALDSRNHGLSDKSDDYGYHSMMLDVISFIKVLDIKSPSLIGFSDGAIVGLMIALSESGLLDKLVLMGANLSPSDFKDESLEWLKDEFKKNNDPLFKLMLEEPNIDLESLKSISNKSLVIAGEDDIFKDETFDNIARMIPDAELKIMKGHDHASYIIGQDILFPTLKYFLEGV